MTKNPLNITDRDEYINWHGSNRARIYSYQPQYTRADMEDCWDAAQDACRAQAEKAAEYPATIERLRGALARIAKYPEKSGDELGYEGCRHVARAALAETDHFAGDGKMVAGEWIKVSDRMPEPGQKVLAVYKNSAGKWRRIVACWVPKKSMDDDCDSDLLEYDEDTDSYYWPEGRYEQIDNWGDFSRVFVNETVSHWQELPAPPKE